MLKKIGAICLAFLLGIALLPNLTLAQSTIGLESRLSRLESENFQLRSQINQLESQVNRLLNQSQQPQRTAPIRPTPTVTPRRQPRQPVATNPTSNQIVDRLATLVIELKERVNRLEAQVAELKRRSISS